MKIAKVLQTTRSESVTYFTGDGNAYTFFAGASNPDCKGMELIKSDAHADSLLARYPGELKVVADHDVPAKYKKNVEDYIAAVTTEAVAKFPVLKDKILGKKSK